ncbi:hypothetical protein DIPPA_30448 [Diplonema papillatum]|nr:hypothetical protein DIPPA_30448 [Diplonema papillatum]
MDAESSVDDPFLGTTAFEYYQTKCRSGGGWGASCAEGCLRVLSRWLEEQPPEAVAAAVRGLPMSVVEKLCPLTGSSASWATFSALWRPEFTLVDVNLAGKEYVTDFRIPRDSARSLRRLDVSRTNVTDQFFELNPAVFLEENPTLLRLSLEGCRRVSRDGVLRIAGGLAAVTHLGLPPCVVLAADGPLRDALRPVLRRLQLLSGGGDGVLELLPLLPAVHTAALQLDAALSQQGSGAGDGSGGAGLEQDDDAFNFNVFSIVDSSDSEDTEQDATPPSTAALPEAGEPQQEAEAASPEGHSLQSIDLTAAEPQSEGARGVEPSKPDSPVPADSEDTEQDATAFHPPSTAALPEAGEHQQGAEAVSPEGHSLQSVDLTAAEPQSEGARGVEASKPDSPVPADSEDTEQDATAFQPPFTAALPEAGEPQQGAEAGSPEGHGLQSVDLTAADPQFEGAGQEDHPQRGAEAPKQDSPVTFDTENTEQASCPQEAVPGAAPVSVHDDDQDAGCTRELSASCPQEAPSGALANVHNDDQDAATQDPTVATASAGSFRDAPAVCPSTQQDPPAGAAAPHPTPAAIHAVQHQHASAAKGSHDTETTHPFDGLPVFPDPSKERLGGAIPPGGTAAEVLQETYHTPTTHANPSEQESPVSQDSTPQELSGPTAEVLQGTHPITTHGIPPEDELAVSTTTQELSGPTAELVPGTHHTTTTHASPPEDELPVSQDTTSEELPEGPVPPSGAAADPPALPPAPLLSGLQTPPVSLSLTATRHAFPADLFAGVDLSHLTHVELFGQGFSHAGGTTAFAALQAAKRLRHLSLTLIGEHPVPDADGCGKDDPFWAALRCMDELEELILACELAGLPCLWQSLPAGLKELRLDGKRHEVAGAGRVSLDAAALARVRFPKGLRLLTLASVASLAPRSYAALVAYCTELRQVCFVDMREPGEDLLLSLESDSLEYVEVNDCGCWMLEEDLADERWLQEGREPFAWSTLLARLPRVASMLLYGTPPITFGDLFADDPAVARRLHSLTCPTNICAPAPPCRRRVTPPAAAPPTTLCGFDEPSAEGSMPSSIDHLMQILRDRVDVLHPGADEDVPANPGTSSTQSIATSSSGDAPSSPSSSAGAEQPEAPGGSASKRAATLRYLNVVHDSAMTPTALELTLGNLPDLRILQLEACACLLRLPRFAKYPLITELTLRFLPAKDAALAWALEGCHALRTLSLHTSEVSHDTIKTLSKLQRLATLSIEIGHPAVLLSLRGSSVEVLHVCFDHAYYLNSNVTRSLATQNKKLVAIHAPFSSTNFKPDLLQRVSLHETGGLP